MPSRFEPGEAVQTPFGKGIVRDVRNNGRLLVEVGQRTLVMAESTVSPLQTGYRTPSAPPAPAAARERHERHALTEVDLHGLTVEEALARIDQALNEALLASVPELRFIHGRTGGRLRGALHQRLRAIPTVRGFRLDPRNAGVTIVSF